MNAKKEAIDHRINQYNELYNALFYEGNLRYDTISIFDIERFFNFESEMTEDGIDFMSHCLDREKITTEFYRLEETTSMEYQFNNVVERITALENWRDETFTNKSLDQP